MSSPNMDLLPSTDYTGPIVIVAYFNEYNIINVFILDDVGNVLNFLNQAVTATAPNGVSTIVPYDQNSFVVVWEDYPCCNSLWMVLIRLDGK